MHHDLGALSTESLFSLRTVLVLLERRVSGLAVLEGTLARANRLLIRLTPIGVFAITAHRCHILWLALHVRL